MLNMTPVGTKISLHTKMQTVGAVRQVCSVSDSDGSNASGPLGGG